MSRGTFFDSRIVDHDPVSPLPLSAPGTQLSHVASSAAPSHSTSAVLPKSSASHSISLEGPGGFSVVNETISDSKD